MTSLWEVYVGEIVDPIRRISFGRQKDQVKGYVCERTAIGGGRT